MKNTVYDTVTNFLEVLLDDYINMDTEDKALHVLAVIIDNIPNITMPRIGPGPQGMVGFTWEGDSYHINIEIMEKSPYVEVFIERVGFDSFIEEHDKISINAINIIKSCLDKG